MASSQIFVLLAVLAIFAPSISATDYVVGDNKGWTINFDYQAWVEGKTFYVGDNLVFNYPKGAHTVLKVNETGFQECAAPLGTVPFTTGSDVIPLATPGRKWYICGVAKHCELGSQKLVLTVMLSASPSPSPSNSIPSAPSPSAAATTSVGTTFGLAILAAAGFLMV